MEAPVAPEKKDRKAIVEAEEKTGVEDRVVAKENKAFKATSETKVILASAVHKAKMERRVISE